MQTEAFIDTNVFLRFLIFDKSNPNMSELARKAFLMLKEGKIILYTNVLIIAETVYVLEKYYELSKNEVREKLIPILVYDNLVIDGKEKVLAALTIFYEKNVDFEDAYTYFDMLNSQILKIITFDEKHFKRFDDVEILTIA